jgi:hypothetical protein
MQLEPLAALAAPCAASPALLAAAASIAPAIACPPGTIVQAAVFATVWTTLFLASFFAFPQSPPLLFGFAAVESGTESVAAATWAD